MPNQIMLRSPLRSDTLAFLRSLSPEDFFGWGATALPSFGIPFPSDLTKDRLAMGSRYRDALLTTKGEPTPLFHRLFDNFFDRSQAPLDAQYTACILLRYIAVSTLFTE